MAEPAAGRGDERAANTARPVVLPETFDGTENWGDWYLHFENVAAVNGWDDAEKLKWLRVRLTGRAQKALHRLPEASRATYEATLTALKAASSPTAVKLAITRSCRHGENEQVKDGRISQMT